MDRYSKSSEGIYQGSKVARNSFGSSSSSHAPSTVNHSTQTANEHVRLNTNTNTTNTTSSSSNDNHNYAKAHRGTSNTNNDNSNDLRDALSMSTKDKAVQQQLQKSQFYQRGLHDIFKTSNTGKKNRILEDEDDDAAAVATDEDEEIDRKLDPNMYDNVQY
ncbi:MAG: hypothetical protein JOS17DRAFT_737577, partial [Linnemannia elongata]